MPSLFYMGTGQGQADTVTLRIHGKPYAFSRGAWTEVDDRAFAMLKDQPGFSEHGQVGSAAIEESVEPQASRSRRRRAEPAEEPASAAAAEVEVDPTTEASEE